MIKAINNPYKIIFVTSLILLSCAQPKATKTNPKMNEALLVITVQEGFFMNPNNPVYNEAELTPNINLLVDNFRKLDKPIIFIHHIDEDLVEDTKPWEVYSKLHSKPEDIHLNKTTPDSFYKTDLSKVLKEHNIGSIVIVGLQTDYCIDTTCKSAFGKEIPTTLVSDAHSTYDNSLMTADKIIEYHNTVLGSWFAKLKTTDYVINSN